jgi:mannose-6-phosphate isomerase-like protein (cupin superfamily)
MRDIESKKQALFHQVAAQLQQQGFSITKEDPARPWGGFLVIDEDQASSFADAYFNGLSVDELAGKLSPKILVVAPHQRLSWQYHHRRAEIWQVVQGPVGIATSDTDEQHETKSFQVGERIILQQGERHRLVGLKDWGVVAELWQHTDAHHPSDEDDIVRVQDDFGR